MTCVRIVLAFLVALGAVPGHLGSGDDVRPRDTVSVVQSVSPALPDGVSIDIVGGDTFLRVRATGHSVTVAGYEDEPYLRISADGLVEENTASQTSSINTSRYGGTATSTAGALPVWRAVASDGTVMWHDHRIHWMSPVRPAVIDPDGTVLKWEVPVAVDGTVHTVRGTLYLRDRATAAWWLLGLVGLGAAALLARAHRRRYYAAVLAVGAWSAVTGYLQWSALPAGARITPLMLVFGAGTALTGAAALFAARRTDPRSDWVASSLAAGAGAAMLVATWMSYEQVLSAYVPTAGPVWTARANVAVLLGFGVVAVIDGVMRVMRVESDAQ